MPTELPPKCCNVSNNNVGDQMGFRDDWIRSVGLSLRAQPRLSAVVSLRRKGSV
jgi:hypothetical protein